MWAKALVVIFNWATTAIIIPIIAFFYDSYKLRKENKELKLAIENLKNAKTKPQIDAAIDAIN